MARQHGLIRLFVDAPLRAGAEIELGHDQKHYLGTVLRAEVGTPVHLFNGRDGEWQGHVAALSKRRCTAAAERRRRPQPAATAVHPLWLAFALVRRGATETMVQKATELGVDGILPVATARAVRQAVKPERLRAIAIAAAEQSDRLDVPWIERTMAFADALPWLAARGHILLADETGGGRPLASVLGGPKAARRDGGICLFVGPEGGFTAAELDAASGAPNLTKIDLGPHILRADTAAIGGLAIIQALTAGRT